MFQQVTIVGNLGDEPVMRYTQGGTPVTNFSVATNKTWKDQNGNTQTRTVWFRVSTWRRQAETCSEYLHKGSLVMCIGEMQDARPWTDKNGNVQASLEMTAFTVKFLQSRRDAQQAAARNGSTNGQPQEEDFYVDPESMPF